MKPDHLAVSASTLEAGADYVEAVLGVPLEQGGQHPHMGTHNRLLSLGPDFYLEVIAIDPKAPTPDHPRWFNLDNFTGPPRLSNWIAKTDDMDRALSQVGAGFGVPTALERGDFRWKMAVPQDGHLPFDEMFPALIEWQGRAHPAQRLPDRGCRLKRLIISHPKGDALLCSLHPMMDMNQISVTTGPKVALVAEIETPAGLRVLQ